MSLARHTNFDIGESAQLTALLLLSRHNAMHRGRCALRDTLVENATQLQPNNEVYRTHSARAKQAHLVKQKVCDAAMAAQAGVDDAGVQHECSDATGRVYARIEFLSEQHVGKLAVVIIPESEMMPCAHMGTNCIGHTNAKEMGGLT